LKWYFLCGHDTRIDLFLLHEYRPNERPALLPRFASLSICPICGKFDEEELLAIGFDSERLLPMPQDILSQTNDLPLTVVSAPFRQVCDNGVEGVRFIPCGRSRTRGAMFLMWPTHQSRCRVPVEDWLRSPIPAGEPAYHVCHLCGRPEQVVGFPPRSSLELPDELTISVPATPTYMKKGRDFRFFCSDAVRTVFKKAGLKGICFSEMEQMEKRMKKWFDRPSEGPE
jgi:hypothetical protein